MLDNTDKQLLELIQKDCRLTNAQLAAELNISASSCWRRIKSLEDIGLITGYHASIDRNIAGFAFSAIVHVSLSRQKADTVSTFVNAIRNRPEIMDCYATTGDADYHLRVVVEDINAFNKFLDEFLFPLPGIAHVKSNIVLKDVKQGGHLPFKIVGR
ncbi:Lrp/AsnC family transcriptional regulator [Sneathiella limimaris]|uniref:Lrp/AsnC family transcriptional regulator n=1 Tax=Sneathiella limimaris TaxID=1964213 RepID=UPI00146C0A60|nr:Lrp/AsnC family transcriptional regulator [Sneathiella limimaris]